MGRRPGRSTAAAGAPGPPASLALAAAVAIAGCTTAPTAEAPAATATAAGVETASVGGYDFVLEGGELRYAGPRGAAGAFTIDTPLGCRLARDPDGAVRTRETEAGLVFLVVCSEVEREIGGRPLCETLIRGVVVAADGVRLPDRSQRVGACPPAAWDEKTFLYFVE